MAIPLSLFLSPFTFLMELLSVITGYASVAITSCIDTNQLLMPGVRTKKGLESGFSVLREAVTAIDRPALRRLEGNFALFAAVRTDCLMELAGAVLVRAGTPTRVSILH